MPQKSRAEADRQYWAGDATQQCDLAATAVRKHQPRHTPTPTFDPGMSGSFLTLLNDQQFGRVRTKRSKVSVPSDWYVDQPLPRKAATPGQSPPPASPAPRPQSSNAWRPRPSVPKKRYGSAPPDRLQQTTTLWGYQLQGEEAQRCPNRTCIRPATSQGFNRVRANSDARRPKTPAESASRPRLGGTRAMKAAAEQERLEVEDFIKCQNEVTSGRSGKAKLDVAKAQEIMGDINYFQAQTTPKVRRLRWYKSKARMPHQNFQTPRLIGWQKRIEDRPSALTLDPQAKFTEVLELRQMQRRQEATLRSSKADYYRACMKRVISLLTMGPIRYALYDWKVNSDVVKANETSFLEAVKITTSLSTMKSVVKRWIQQPVEDAVTHWYANFYGDGRIKERKAKFTQHVLDVKRQSEELVKALFTEFDTITRDGFLSVPELQRVEHATVNPQISAFGRHLLADNMKVFNQYDYDLSGKISIDELRGAARAYVEEDLRRKSDLSGEFKALDSEILRGHNVRDKMSAVHARHQKLTLSKRWPRLWTGLIQRVADRYQMKDYNSRLRDMQRDPKFSALVWAALKHPILSNLCDSIWRVTEILRFVQAQGKLGMQAEEEVAVAASAARGGSPRGTGRKAGNATLPKGWKMEQRPLSKKDMRAARLIFNRVDEDGSNSINMEELGQCLSMMGAPVSDSELSAMFNKIDDDGNGRIDFLEFAEHVFAPRLVPEGMPRSGH